MLPPIEKLLKFIRLEKNRNYDNRAVVGGLEKIIPSWKEEATKANLRAEDIETVLSILAEYPSQDLISRTASLETLTTILNNIQPQPDHMDSTSASSLRNPDRQAWDGPDHKADGRQRQFFAKPETTQNQGLDAPLTVISGVGPRNAQSLDKLDLHTLFDLLHYYPRRYDDYSQLKPISHLMYGDEVTVIGTIQSTSTRSFRRGQGTILEAVLSDGTGYIRLTWFNQPWLQSKLTNGLQIVISGRVEMYLGRLLINSPEWEPIDQEQLHTNRVVPIYPLTASISQRWLRKVMYQTVSFWAPRIQDPLPESMRLEAKIMDLSSAIKQIHFPDSQTGLDQARERLAFDEILLLQIGVLLQKRNWQLNTAKQYTVTDLWLETFKKQLPYELTAAQIRAIEDLRKDLLSGRPMNRLLQGDVGSGKTVVAALAVAVVCSHGDQGAIMAPTSILAEQHYRNFMILLAQQEDPLLRPEEIRLMLGATPEVEKENIRNGLEQGTIKIVIGTHALLEETVNFNNLQIAVIDEQHRFGVEQRASLRTKGSNPHLLVMTATPIPRSLALTVYGDLDLSVIDEMPVGRQPVETHVLHPNEIERAYQLIQAQINKGRQAFLIYPLIEKGENEDTKSAVEEFSRLQAQIFPNQKLGLLHGRMPADEKEKTMQRFRDKELDILVSTSVVEVGVDIPNATVMLIEGANRFGLAQLHQFRGRVGRGADQSYCLLIPERENNLENQRLQAMVESNDGFVLAERDLDQRGPGDFLGTRQSGFAELKMAKLTDTRLIEKARRFALNLFEIDPDFLRPEHQLLRKAYQQFWKIGRGDIS